MCGSKRTGTGLIILLVCLMYKGAVCRMKSGAVCLMNIWRVGCICSMRVAEALNILSVVVEWRVNWRSKECKWWCFRELRRSDVTGLE